MPMKERVMTYASADICGRPTPGALLIFDEAMNVRSKRNEYLSAARELNRMTDHELSEIGINRSDIEETIRRYV